MERYLKITVDCNTVHCGSCEKLNRLNSRCKEFGKELRFFQEEFLNHKGKVLKFDRCRECIAAEIQDEEVR